MSLTEEELIYLRGVANTKWYSVPSFNLDKVSLGLIQKGLLEAAFGRGIYWELTPEGRRALGLPS
jgi:hypothetical protein